MFADAVKNVRWWACGLGLLVAGTMVSCAGMQPGAASKLEAEAKKSVVAPASGGPAGWPTYHQDRGSYQAAAMAHQAYFFPALEARSSFAGAAGPAGFDGRPPFSVYPSGPADGQPLFPYQAEVEQGPGLDYRLEKLAREVAGKVFYQLREDEPEIERLRLAVVVAVPISDLKRESEFGRVVAEYLLTDLADRGLSVTELRLGRDIHIIPQTGEFVLSRNIGEMASHQQDLDYVVVSTYSNTRRTLVLHGRLVALDDGLVRTSWRHSLPLDRELRGLFEVGGRPSVVNIRSMM